MSNDNIVLLALIFLLFNNGTINLTQTLLLAALFTAGSCNNYRSGCGDSNATTV